MQKSHIFLFSENLQHLITLYSPIKNGLSGTLTGSIRNFKEEFWKFFLLLRNQINILYFKYLRLRIFQGGNYFITNIEAEALSPIRKAGKDKHCHADVTIHVKKCHIQFA